MMEIRMIEIRMMEIRMMEIRMMEKIPSFDPIVSRYE